MLEREPINRLTNENQLSAFKHYGFWQCMDTLRDKELLNKIWKLKKSMVKVKNKLIISTKEKSFSYRSHRI